MPRLERLLITALPVSSRHSTAQRTSLAAGFACLIATMLVTVAHIVTGVGGASWESAIHGGVIAIFFSICAAIVSLRAITERRQRMLWVLAAAGIWSYAVAMLLWGFWLENVRNPPDPSICDFFWWATYPLLAAGIVGAGRGLASRGVTAKIWLDGLIAGSATAAVAAAFVLPQVVNSATGAHEAVFANLLYPLGDLVLGTLLVGVVGLRGWRLDRRWGLFVAAFVCLLVADSANSIQVAHGAVTSDSQIQLIYMAAFLCMALGAWQPSRPRHPSRGAHLSTLVLPAAFALTAPAILIYDQFSRVPMVAFALTMVALLAAMVRLALALQDVLTVGELRRAAMTDDLTGLPNRRMFFDVLRQSIANVEREGGALTALMFDLDNFKQINDTLGHDAGDTLLRRVGPRLNGCMPHGSVIARLGGDEFAILLAPGDQGDVANEVAVAVLESLREPFSVRDVMLRLTASVGIASYPGDANTPEELIQCMDVAMYEAKRSRRGFERYAPERDLNTTERLQLADALASALDGGEIEAHFQPILDTTTRRVVGAETLARWRRPDGTMRPPSEFLDAAEMYGLSRQLTRHMLELALREAADWPYLGATAYVSVNVTVADLLDESFPTEVAAVLAKHEVRPEALMIEVTERSFLADPGRASQVLHELRAIGVRLALDDFGTGYSSLTHLRELPVDTIKIDRSFVSRMCEENADAAIVYATVELAHRLGLEVVAEGVENEQTWSALRQLGSERVQGYGCGYPGPAADLRERLSRPDEAYLAESQSVPTPASTASGGSIS